MSEESIRKHSCDVTSNDYIASDEVNVKTKENPVAITKAACGRIKYLLSPTEDADITDDCKFIGLRVGVKPGGCVGFKYGFERVKEKVHGDIEIVLDNGLYVFVPPGSMLYIVGTTLDYKVNHADFSEGFIFINPNAKGSCGCGGSFYV